MNDQRWDEFVYSHKFGSIFHLSNWCKVLGKTFSYKPCYIVLEEEEQIRAGIAFMMIKSWLTGNRLISLPRTSYCDPLFENENDFELLISFVLKILRKHKLQFFEIKTQYNNELQTAIGLKCYGYFKNQIINLDPGPEGVWKQLHRTCIRQRILKAQKDNIKVRISNNIKDLRLFYDLHIKTTLRHSVPPRPYEFFKNIWENLEPIKLVILLIAELNETPCAAGIFLKFKDTMIFEFHGINNDLLEHSPGHIMVWEAIQLSYKEGIKYFDFGLTPPDNLGLINFKRRWGTEEKTLLYYYYPDVTGYKKFVKKTDFTVYRKLIYFNILKNKAKRYISSKLYKHFG